MGRCVRAWQHHACVCACVRKGDTHAHSCSCIPMCAGRAVCLGRQSSTLLWVCGPPAICAALQACGVGVHECMQVCTGECVSLVVAVTAGRDRGDWRLPVAALALGDAAGLLQPLSAQGPLPSRTGWATPRIKSGAEAGFCGRVLWPCHRGKGSWEEKYLQGVPFCPQRSLLSPACRLGKAALL